MCVLEDREDIEKFVVSLGMLKIDWVILCRWEWATQENLSDIDPQCSLVVQITLDIRGGLTKNTVCIPK